MSAKLRASAAAPVKSMSMLLTDGPHGIPCRAGRLSRTSRNVVLHAPPVVEDLPDLVEIKDVRSVRESLRYLAPCLHRFSSSAEIDGLSRLYRVTAGGCAELTPRNAGQRPSAITGRGTAHCQRPSPPRLSSFQGNRAGATCDAAQPVADDLHAHSGPCR